MKKIKYANIASSIKNDNFVVSIKKFINSPITMDIMAKKTRAPCPKCGEINDRPILSSVLKKVRRICAICQTEWHTTK